MEVSNNRKYGVNMVFSNRQFDPDPRYIVSVALLQGSISNALKTKLRRRMKFYAGFDFLDERAKFKKEIKSKASNGKMVVHLWSEGDDLSSLPDAVEIPATVASYLIFTRKAKGKYVVINSPALILTNTFPSEFKLHAVS